MLSLLCSVDITFDDGESGRALLKDVILIVRMHHTAPSHSAYQYPHSAHQYPYTQHTSTHTQYTSTHTQYTRTHTHTHSTHTQYTSTLTLSTPAPSHSAHQHPPSHSQHMPAPLPLPQDQPLPNGLEVLVKPSRSLRHIKGVVKGCPGNSPNGPYIVAYSKASGK